MSAPFLRLVVERPYGEPGTYIGDEHTALVAKLYDGQEHYAKLFAAAPELLSALADAAGNLEHAARINRGKSFAEGYAQAAANARAAISKAGGAL